MNPFTDINLLISFVPRQVMVTMEVSLFIRWKLRPISVQKMDLNELLVCHLAFRASATKRPVVFFCAA